MATRIQKVLSECGFCSRRKAEEMVAQGRVKINGHPASIGAQVNPAKDIISVDGENVFVPRRKEYLYLMLHKPRGYITTMEDEMGRKTVRDLVADVDARVYPIGRLDKNSEGLLLMTNDGQFANMLMHPSYHVSKKYRVTIRPTIDEEQLTLLSTGVMIDGRMTEPAVVNVVTKETGRVVLEMTIREGRNRQIRKMCEAVGLEVVRLKRTAIGPVKLGMLKPGEYRELKPAELDALRRSAIKGKAANVVPHGKKENLAIHPIHTQSSDGTKKYIPKSGSRAIRRQEKSPRGQL